MYLEEKATWKKKTKDNPNRGYIDDAADGDGKVATTAKVKAANLDLMLGQIANFAPIISRNTIIKNSTSLSSIWKAIRLYYGFHSSGARLIDFCDIRLGDDERYEALYQRMVSFIEDNLLKADGGIKHDTDADPEDEELTPTLESLIVLLWLKAIHPDLPKEVQQRFGTELRGTTIFALKPEISRSLDCMLTKIKSGDEARVMLARPQHSERFARPQHSERFARPQHSERPARSQSGFHDSRPRRECPICKQARMGNTNHFLSQCKYLSEADRTFLRQNRQTRTRQIIVDVPLSDGEESDSDCSQEENPKPVMSRRIKSKGSPSFKAFLNEASVTLTLDTGAEANMIKAPFARHMGMRIKNTNQTALQADGVTPLEVVGATRVFLTRNGIKLDLDALVVAELDVDILAGTPFMITNDIAVRPAKSEITIKQSEVITYGVAPTSSTQHAVRRVQSTLTVWPGEAVEVKLPAELQDEEVVAVEPRIDTKHTHGWPSPQMADCISGKIRLANTSHEPQVLLRDEHFCQVSPTADISPPPDLPPALPVRILSTKVDAPYSQNVSIDPGRILPDDIRTELITATRKYDRVFNPNIKGYNHASGHFEAIVNVGPVEPPQRKGRVPQYARNKLVELQSTFNKLEEQGVFMCPEEAGVVVEYVNPSFLVKKSNGGHRLVTAFTEVAKYCKPTPSMMPDVDSILRTISSWKYIVTTDLTKAFYQIPLSKDSLKYCGVVTPFKGVRVYMRSAMGMPGSETALEELMCKVLGELLQEGVVTKIADDLYCGGDTPKELLSNWIRVLQALDRNDLSLSASKTVVCPKSTTILGWIWSLGTLQASPHRIASLSITKPPDTVKGLRSFIGAFKVLSRVLPSCANIVAPLDEAIIGLTSPDKITWSDDLLKSFSHAQASLKSCKSITLPKPSDQLWIVTDASVKQRGLGSTLYVTRDTKLHLAGFFSAKPKKHQVTWLPCELEALAIACSIKHFSPYIIQSTKKACALTDSKPCVQALEKLSRGEFSSSPRVTTFLAIASRYQVSLQHLSGTANIPSDFSSRNATECAEECCQICSFIHRTEESVIRQLSVTDIVSGKASLPYTSRSAWRSLQVECPDLRRVHAHLHQGTWPSKKHNNVLDVKRYLHMATLSSDGLIVVRKADPLAPSRECIVVPRSVLPGILTSLHIKLHHPSKHQLKLAFQRQFYALNLDIGISDVTDNCHLRTSLKTIPQSLEQSSEDPPDAVGISFAADVLKRNRQTIFILRETVSSYTVTRLLSNEQHDSLRSALMSTCLELRPLDGPPSVIKS
jgi:hypothetical protein